MSLGDRHGPYFALFGKRGKPSMQLIDNPGPHFVGNADLRGDRIARVVLVEIIDPDQPCCWDDDPNDGFKHFWRTGCGNHGSRVGYGSIPAICPHCSRPTHAG